MDRLTRQPPGHFPRLTEYRDFRRVFQQSGHCVPDLGANSSQGGCMFRTSILATVFAVGCLSAASAAMIDFHTSMTGKSEVPPNATTGSGDVLATLDTNTKKLTYTMTYYGLTGPATAAHFHGPAAPGTNAGVVVPIGNNPASPTSGTATLTDDQMKDLEAGKWYANVHTAANKGGEIRGQMMRSDTHAAAEKPMKSHAPMPMKSATPAAAPAPAATPAPATKP
jgi:CHRD domain